MSVDVRSRLSRSDRMEQTLGGAHGLFAERGYGEVTMEEIAAAVGVTKPLLYNYFGNKERLYITCMERAGDTLTRTVGEAISGTASPRDALGAGVRAFFAFLDSDRAAWAVLFDETLPASGEVTERVGAYRNQIVALGSDSLLAQLPDPRRGRARVEIEALSAALLGAAEELARWWLRTEAIPADEAAELLISTVEPGIRARSQAAPDSPTSPKPGKGPSKRCTLRP